MLLFGEVGLSLC